MNNLKLITLLCLLMQGCSTTPHQANTPINDMNSIILTPQQDQVFDNAASQPVSPNTAVQDKITETPQPTLEDVKPTRSYWF